MLWVGKQEVMCSWRLYRSLIWPAVRDVAMGMTAGVTACGTGFELHRGRKPALCLTGEQLGDRELLRAAADAGDCGDSLMVHENR